MQALIDVASPVITLLLLVAVGMELTPGDFRPVRQRPVMVAAGVLLPPLLLPILALGLIELVKPSPVIARGLLLLVVCPIGGISNTYSVIARASTALSVALTAVSCTAALGTVPLGTLLIEWVLGHPLAYSAPVGTVVRQLVLVLFPAIATGMAIRARWPSVAARHKHLVQRVAFTLLVLLLALVIGSAAGQHEIGWPSAVLVVTLFVVLAFALGGAVAWLLGGSPADRFTFCAEFSTRNVAFALALAMALGRQQEVVWFGGIYLVVEIPLLVSAALLYRALVGGAAEPAMLRPVVARPD